MSWSADPDAAPSAPFDEPNEPSEGDSACWLARVCPVCGALTDRPSTPICERCGSAVTPEPS